MTIRGIWVAVCLFAFVSVPGYSQTSGSGSGTVRGMVLDPSNAAIAGAKVRLQNPVSLFDKTVDTDGQGNFTFPNVPYANYHLSATAPGFDGSEQDVTVNSPVPTALKIVLAIGATNETVTVTGAGDLVETDPSTHTDVDRELFDKLPLESSSSSLSSLVTLASPGVSSDSNGLMHGLGDHAENSFSIDGQPVTDQQSKVFSNQLPVEAIQSMEVIEGAPPAEFGDKTSLVVVVTTRSGLGQKPPHGDVSTSYGTFGTSSSSFDLAYGGQNLGNFISLSGLDTGRFLDPPEYQVFHAHGNEESAFDRLDFKLSDKDSVNLNLEFTRSWFQTPNSYDAQDATAWSGPLCISMAFTAACNGIGPNGQLVGPQDQRAQIKTYNIAPTWTRILDAHSVLTVNVYDRRDQFNYYPSRDPFSDLTPDLQLSTEAQDRSLANIGGRATYSWVSHTHNFKAGLIDGQTFVTENDSFGLVDPTANAPCLYGNGAPDTSSLLVSQAGCTGGLTPNRAFIPLLACYDLTRTAPLPASYGCPSSTGSLYDFYGHADVKELALFAQDAITAGPWTFNLGVRFDKYNGLTRAAEGEPRLGIAYNFKPTNSVIRLSYARTMETPFNENLVLASVGCTYAPIVAFQSAVPGGACINDTPLSPGHRNEFHAGITQAFGKYLVLDGEYIWKYTHKAFDFSVLGNTPITYPIEWESSKIPGYALRATMPNFHGLSAYVVMSSVAARFFGPQVAGIGAGPGGNTVFRIDHDERFNQTTHMQYQPWKNGPWLSFNWRYDSGEVAGPAPCAGGMCTNGPNGSDSIVDVSRLTPDQQFQAGLFCGPVYATPTTPISPNDLCPTSQYGSKFINIPAAGTENDDHNPPRIAGRNLIDLGIGDDNLFHGDKYKWSARFTVVNLTNKEALYNFISTFSGTHYVSPRTVTASLGFHF